jgi:hypothetical protein
MADVFFPEKHSKFLYKATLIYVTLPSILFIGGWLRIYWAAPLLMVLAYLLTQAFITENSNTDADTTYDWPGTVGILAIAAYICYATGVGGHVEQSFNYVYDNIKLYDLVANSWPVYYPDKEAFYCYYFGYYLPIAAFINAFSGVEHAEAISFIWAWLGVALCCFWVRLLLQFRRSWMVIIFLLTGTFGVALTFFNSLDVKFLRAVEDFSYPYTFIKTWWSGGRPTLNTSIPFHCAIKYASTMTTMAWAPYHYISGMLFPALAYYQIVRRKTFNSVPLIAVSTLIWSPFVLLGMLPILLYGLLRFFRTIFNLQSVLAIILLSPFLIFLTSHDTSESIVRGFIWECKPRWWLNYILFVGIEVGIFGFVIFLYGRRYLCGEERTVLIFNLVALAVIPLVYVGFYNDFSIKVGIAPMFYLVLFFVKVISRMLVDFRSGNRVRWGSWSYVIVLALWLMSAITPFNILLIP